MSLFMTLVESAALLDTRHLTLDTAQGKGVGRLAGWLGFSLLSLEKARLVRSTAGLFLVHA